MRKLLIACAATILTLAGICLSAETPTESVQSSDEVTYPESLPGAKIAYIPWDAANIAKLCALDQAAIVEFYDLSEPPEEDFGGFTWADLAGDGRYALLLTTYTKATSTLYIYWQDAPGKLRMQLYNGGGDPANSIKDLNGHGKKELILYAVLDAEARTNTNAVPVATWPQVYRLENKRYVEASHDFPKFYDSEVLPELEKDIREGRELVADQQRKPKPTPGPLGNQLQIDTMLLLPERGLAATVMERDKILRVLGRKPDAGLAQAREWMKSSDPELVEDAVVVLRDMGAHPQDLAAAKAALRKLDPSEAELQDFIDKQKP